MSEQPPAALALTGREDLVLRLIVLGYSNKQIAGRLKLSVKTVETYKSRGVEKLGCYDRVALVRHAIAAGWLLTADAPDERVPRAGGDSASPLSPAVADTHDNSAAR